MLRVTDRKWFSSYLVLDQITRIRRAFLRTIGLVSNRLVCIAKAFTVIHSFGTPITLHGTHVSLDNNKFLTKINFVKFLWLVLLVGLCCSSSTNTFFFIECESLEKVLIRNYLTLIFTPNALMVTYYMFVIMGQVSATLYCFLFYVQHVRLTCK